MRRGQFLLASLLLAVFAGAMVAEPLQQRGARQQRRQQQQQARRQQRQDPYALKVGQMAPKFALSSLDGKSSFTLEELRGDKPVVLFFGSYT